ncbi:MAG: transcription termination/antitermination protein NusA, partial [Schwartzia sp.]|nr:transcription termination/antitermination protein NusA [Schwartzia sp. (in: firmicutes)]
QLSLAIGKEGQNARLAAKLTGWKIDIKSESQAADEEIDESMDLVEVTGEESFSAEGDAE